MPYNDLKEIRAAPDLPLRKGFSNETMHAPRPSKPHIQFIQGRWRVSSSKDKRGHLLAAWFAAHAFIQRLNREGLYRLRRDSRAYNTESNTSTQRLLNAIELWYILTKENKHVFKMALQGVSPLRWR